MEKTKDSKLSFGGFKIIHSLIDLNGGSVGKNLDISIGASGEINKPLETFHLKLEVNITDDMKAISINVEASADFKVYDGSIDNPEFSNYLYLNAPAILFPYVRAYITALTALSGIPAISIPPVDVSGIKNILKEQTQVIDKPTDQVIFSCLG